MRIVTIKTIWPDVATSMTGLLRRFDLRDDVFGQAQRGRWGRCTLHSVEPFVCRVECGDGDNQHLKFADGSVTATWFDHHGSARF